MLVYELGDRNAGNAETRQHYEDLVVRIKEALNIR